MCLVAVRVVVMVGNVVVVTDIGTYLVSIFVTIVCIMFSLLRHCIWLFEFIIFVFVFGDVFTLSD